MKLFTITIAYAPAALVARSLILYQKHRFHKPYRHIVVDGHYPINQKKNSHDLKLITECFEGVELWDPGVNLGSAQSQNWALGRLDIGPEDFFINLDPDSACTINDWDEALRMQLFKDPHCAMVSCLAPMVVRYRGLHFEMIKNIGRYKYGVATKPTPFNLSMWRYSFVREIGGIPQAGLWWGETEAPFFSHCQRTGFYHAYALDFMENESGKFMQDKPQNDWKNLHMRTAPPDNFLGNYEEYLRWKHPALLEIDTCKDLNNHDHP